MTPFEIRILLHYYYSPDDFRGIDPLAPLWQETMNAFVVEGLVRERKELGPRYEITSRGTAYCMALQRVPLPVQQWVLPEMPKEPLL
jgi:hypothetical protein